MNLATRIAALVATALIALTLLALPALNAYQIAHSATKNRLKMRKYDS